MRKAFSMITAIFVILIMAGLLALVSNLSGKLIKETTAQYKKEQAALLAKSYTEFALLAIQGHSMSPTRACLRTITADINSLNGTPNANGVQRGEGYQVEVKMQYIGLRSQGIACPADATGHGSLGHQTIATAASTSNDISVTVDVYVQYHDLAIVDALGGTATNSDPWITYHRRTLQKL